MQEKISGFITKTHVRKYGLIALTFGALGSIGTAIALKMTNQKVGIIVGAFFAALLIPVVIGVAIGVYRDKSPSTPTPSTRVKPETLYEKMNQISKAVTKEYQDNFKDVLSEDGDTIGVITSNMSEFMYKKIFQQLKDNINTQDIFEITNIIIGMVLIKTYSSLYTENNNAFYIRYYFQRILQCTFNNAESQLRAVLLNEQVIAAYLVNQGILSESGDDTIPDENYSDEKIRCLSCVVCQNEDINISTVQRVKKLIYKYNKVSQQYQQDVEAKQVGGEEQERT